MFIPKQTKQGLYDPQYEHDACGIGFIVNIKGKKSHDIVRHGIEILENLTHRGATGCDPCTGDGAGILIQIPDQFFRRECAKINIELPPEGDYGAGIVFLPPNLANGEGEGFVSYQVRADRELVAVGEAVGFDAERIREGLAEWGRLAARNRERTEDAFVAPGVRRGRHEGPSGEDASGGDADEGGDR